MLRLPEGTLVERCHPSQCAGRQAEAVQLCALMWYTASHYIREHRPSGESSMATMTISAMGNYTEKRQNIRSNGVASELPLPSVIRTEQTPPVEDFGPEVGAFLDRYPFLVPLLRESVDPLRKIF